MKKRLLPILLALLMLLSLSACGGPTVYEVRFELNGGTLVSGQLLQHVEKDAAAVPPVIEREGYDFVGWNNEIDAVQENLVVLPLWKAKKPVFEVRFELNGGLYVSGELLQTVALGGAAEPPVIERPGYEFAGWSTGIDRVTRDLVVVPLWTAADAPLPTFEVRFELNGGSLVSGELLQTVTQGAAAEPPVIERPGYDFVGWDRDTSFVNSNLVVAARWSQCFRIEFDPAGGTLVSGSLEQKITRGLLPEAPELELAYYNFVGWEPVLREATADTTYTALWSARKLNSDEVFSKVSPAVVELEATLWDGESVRLGSGFFLDADGRLVTSYQVIDGALSAEVRLSDGTSCAVKAVVDYNRALDLAILQVDVSDTPWLHLSERGVAPGDTVYTLGSLSGPLASGLVTTAERMINEQRCIQITAPISAENSGGPLLNTYGEVVGVNTMTYISGENLNFSINAEELNALRRAGNMSLQEVFDLEYPDGYSDQTGGFYQLADYPENESNDSYEVSDILRNGSWLAGTVSGRGDLDWFCFALDKACEVDFLVAPYYTDDMDYFAVGLLRLKGQDTEIIDVLAPSEEDGIPVLTGTVKFEKPGIYFMLVCVSDDYPYDDGASYVLRADW